MNAITQTTLCLASPLASTGMVAATVCTAAPKAMRGCRVPQRTFSTTPAGIPPRSTARDLMRQRRPLHINTRSTANTERGITIPRFQAGEALGALRGAPLAARRLQSTSVERTSEPTEPAERRICSERKGEDSDSTAKTSEAKKEDDPKSEKHSFGDWCFVLALGAILALDVIHLAHFIFFEDDRIERIVEEIFEEKLNIDRNRKRNKLWYGLKPDGPDKSDMLRARVRQIIWETKN